MFATQVKILRTRPATTATLTETRHNDFIQEQLIAGRGQKRYRQNKDKIRDLEREYKSVMVSINSLKRSIQTTKHKTCEKRVGFYKSYDVKKIKIQEYDLQEQKKLLDQVNLTKKKRNSKILRLNNQIQAMASRNDLQKNKQIIREKNKTQKLMRKHQLLSTKLFQEQQAKYQYEKVKESELNLREKKKMISEYISIRARHNYQVKLEKEKYLIQSYDNILKEVSGGNHPFGFQSTIDEGQYFFLTEKKDNQDKNLTVDT